MIQIYGNAHTKPQNSPWYTQKKSRSWNPKPLQRQHTQSHIFVMGRGLTPLQRCSRCILHLPTDWATFWLSFFVFEIVWNYWNAGTHSLSHFSDTLMWVLFNKCFQMLVINCRWLSSTLWIIKIFFIPTMELLKPVSYCLISRGPFTSFSIDIVSYLRDILI